MFLINMAKKNGSETAIASRISQKQAIPLPSSHKVGREAAWQVQMS